MITAASLRDSVAGSRVPLALAVLIVLLALDGDRTAQALAYGRDALAQGQWWRALSAHVVHLGGVHAALNVGGLFALSLLCPARLSDREWLRRIGFLALSVSALLYVAAPSVDRYVGLSGVLHGLFVLGLVPMARAGDRLAALCLGVLVVKLVLEQGFGPSTREAELIGGDVVTVAHLFGTLAALVYAFAFGTFRRGEGSQ